MQDYINESWRRILAYNGLSDFDALWKLEAQWFEEPNYRRGGWSGVARCELKHPDGGTCAIFLKRQENHVARLWNYPIKGAPTFLREFQHVMHYRQCGVPTLEPVYFAMRKIDGDHRAILISAELTGFVSMEDRVQRWLKTGAPPLMVRMQMMQAVAKVMSVMHDHGIQHNCFFPKHVFTRLNTDGSVDVRVIDLEKSRWRPLRIFCTIRDLYTINHHSLCWSKTDRLRFFKAYLGIERLTPYAKWLWRHIEKRSIRKNRVMAPQAMLRANSAVND
jgi:hypothetical protein